MRSLDPTKSIVPATFGTYDGTHTFRHVCSTVTSSFFLLSAAAAQLLVVGDTEANGSRIGVSVRRISEDPYDETRTVVDFAADPAPRLNTASHLTPARTVRFSAHDPNTHTLTRTSLYRGRGEGNWLAPH